MTQAGSFDALHAQRWFHTIDLPDGTCTPGVFDMRACSARLDWPDLQGLRCLDVGTCDGFWGFEMERRGAAEVVAIDVDDPEQLDLPGETIRTQFAVLRESAGRRKLRFELAAGALGSRVQRLPCSVFDLDPATHGLFDVVFCGTVLMHLRDPTRALERIAAVCRGELLLVESVDARLDLWNRKTPCARLEPAPLQWWRVNTAGLKAMLRMSGFDVVRTSRHFVTPKGAASAARTPASRAKAWTWARLAASTLPLVPETLGLMLGSYDVAVLARPVSRRLLSREGDKPQEMSPVVSRIHVGPEGPFECARQLEP